MFFFVCGEDGDFLICSFGKIVLYLNLECWVKTFKFCILIFYRSNMSDLAFAELETQVENLPMYQLIILKKKIESIVQKELSSSDEFIFDSLVQHTERADRADEYIKELRANDRF